MIKNQNIICISTQDWNDLWTRKQRFMQRFSRQGNRVLYIEAQTSILSFNIIKSNWKRIFQWLKGPRKIEENLHVATLPLVLPFFQTYFFINKINNWFLLKLLKYWAKKLNLQHLIFWTYTPYSDYFVGKFKEKLAIYDCVDEFSASKGLVKQKTITLLEEKLIRKVGLIIVTHEKIFQAKKEFNKNIYLIPNGVEVEHFKKAFLPKTSIAEEIKKIPKPIIGFIGTIQYWIDLDLIKFIAVTKPNWSIVLIGPIARLAEIEKIKNLKNVYLLGRKKYQLLPFYIKAFDVCINPYKRDKVAEHCSPLKLYEYLAAGKPIVSVNMPEARKFEEFIEIGLDYKDFLRKIQKILDHFPEDSTKIEARLKEAEKHSWNLRFFKLEKILELYLK
ncbi:glycosyltransferase [Candidatus Parcubacteria bacterium]|nr:glycosyltransferase [Candidatus Parcubacteria bacterium]